jgi:hypothetical protein
MDANRSLNANLADYAELSSIGITRNKVARIENGRGLRLRVEYGSLWVTQARSTEDVCMKAGESFCIERNGNTLLSTLGTPFALVTIEPAIPVSRTLAERFWGFWAGPNFGESRGRHA